MINSAPLSAHIKMSDGSTKSIIAHEVPGLFDSVDSRDFWKGPSDAEEGAWIDPRSLERIGGRSEFERGCQRDIIQWLKDNAVENKPLVTIIGDSIRMRIGNSTGYIKHSYRRLIGKVNLEHIPHNSGSTFTGLNLISLWLQSKPDIVHYNAGLHDLSKFRDGSLPKKFADIKKYQSNLREIFEMTLDSGVKTLIWALSTPVDDEWHSRATKETGVRRLIRINTDVIEYNEASIEIANEFKITVNDLFTPLVELGVRKAVLPDGVHLSHEGSRLAGELVAKEVLKHI
jgi:hypothetical protein